MQGLAFSHGTAGDARERAGQCVIEMKIEIYLQLLGEASRDDVARKRLRKGCSFC
jgi:hypothetical protein